MVAPKLRSRTLRRVKVRTPGGKTVTHFRKRKPSKPKCAMTGQNLHGVPQVRVAKMSHIPKSARRPERPYGGVLSSRAMRRLLIARVRSNT